MSKEMLAHLASSRLPYATANTSETEQVIVLRAAGLVDAFVPYRRGSGYASHATVLRLTASARALLDMR